MKTNQMSQAYHTGYEARVQGEARTACPYAAGTWDSTEWLRGWDEAVTRYTISIWDGLCWIWAGDGDTDNGTTTDLPAAVYAFADAGRAGEVVADGDRYRVEVVE